MLHLLWILFLAWAIVNCGKNTPSEKNPGQRQVEGSQNQEDKNPGSGDSQALTRTKFRVAIIDSGFDTSLPIFEGKIQAKVTIKCPKKSGKSGTTRKLSYEKLKEKMIDSMESPDDDCDLVDDIEFKKSKSFAAIESYRDEWNQMVGSKNPKASRMSSQTSQKIIKVLQGEGEYLYHGTQVASFVAYKNSNVEFVFIQYDLAKDEDEIVDNVKCQTQEEIDQQTKLYKDPDIKKAMENSKLSPLEKKIDDLLVEHQVDFINTSFGIPVTKELEKLYAKKGCGQLKLGKNIAAEAEFTRLDSESKNKRGLLKSHALTISALGNDSAEVNSPEVSDHCSSYYTLNVGALNAKGAIASFSNYGKCSDVYLGGEEVIAMAPDGFLFPVSGTSFSSPLFVRYLTQELKTPKNSYKDVFKEWKGSGKKLTGKEMPSELFFNTKDKFSGFQLNGDDSEELPVVRYSFPLEGPRLRGIRLPLN
jgi:hypothetical protein